MLFFPIAIQNVAITYSPYYLIYLLISESESE